MTTTTLFVTDFVGECGAISDAAWLVRLFDAAWLVCLFQVTWTSSLPPLESAPSSLPSHESPLESLFLSLPVWLS